MKPWNWKPIRGYEDLYLISDSGFVWSVAAKTILKHTTNEKGYRRVTLSKNSELKNITVHRLVARAFVENLHFKKQVNHIDGDKKNNFKENLEWVTPSENVYHSYEKGLASNQGSKHPRAKLTEEDIPKIFQLRDGGKTNLEIAEVFDVSRQAISKVLNGRSWGHVFDKISEESLG